MSSVLKGITVILHERVETGRDPFGAPVFEDVLTPVDNVLVAPGDSANSDTDTETRLYGKRILYTLGIPKGDTHHWEDTEVEFFGQTFRSVGFVQQGITELIPLDWDKKLKVERYV